MQITDLLSADSIQLNASVQSRNEAIEQLSALFYQCGAVSDKDEFCRAVLAREEQGTTGVGKGIAIPHGKSSVVLRPCLAAMVIPGGVDFSSLDGLPVHMIFLIAVPEKSHDIHINVLSRLAALLMDQSFRDSLLAANTTEEFLRAVSLAENKKFSCSEQKDSGFEVLAITACPTGIAHTYMAAEALEKAAKISGHTLKVETHGSAGIRNVFTPEEIKSAKSIIVAADIYIDLSRFKGKHLLKASVSDGIKRPEQLINESLSENVPVYQPICDCLAAVPISAPAHVAKCAGQRVYKHLMNGVSHMLPFVVGGGILVALAFLLDDYNINPSNFGMNTPLAAFFNTIGSSAFNVMLFVLAGFIAMDIADKPGLAVGVVGGIMAVKGTTFASLSNPAIPLVSSGFLGALIAGFAAGYILLGLTRLFRHIPKSLDGIKSVLLYPVAGILLTGAFVLFVNPYISSLNMHLDLYLSSMNLANKMLLGTVLGGMMGVDLGGPVNKAAYTFGTGLLAAGHFDIMAAVMAGGMVAPLSIALLATFFPRKIAPADRQAAYLNYLMGLSFISEGAIPFASQDPFKTIPAFIAGSATAGALSIEFSCTLRAPHGGIFVIATVGHPILYLIAILVGALVSMAVMLILKKDISQDKCSDT